MPVYAPPPALVARADAESARDAQQMSLRFGAFWGGFVGNGENSLQCLLRLLCAGQAGGAGRPVNVISVFDGIMDLKRPSWNRDDAGAAYVAFSGEPFHLPPEWFDVSLIMAPEDPERGVVCLPNFATNAHEFGLWPRLAEPRPPQQQPQAQRFCVFVVKNGSAPTRNRFMELLSEYKRVDSAGGFRNNMPGGLTAPEDAATYGDRYFPFLRQYKFMMCFENSKHPGYVTEKLLNAYAAGTVPIYWGTPEVLTWLNPKAFLFLEDESENAMRALVKRVRAMDVDGDAYQAMYREPLLRPEVGIPEAWTLDSVRQRIGAALTRRGKHA